VAPARGRGAGKVGWLRRCLVPCERRHTPERLSRRRASGAARARPQAPWRAASDGACVLRRVAPATLFPCTAAAVEPRAAPGAAKRLGAKRPSLGVRRVQRACVAPSEAAPVSFKTFYGFERVTRRIATDVGLPRSQKMFGEYPSCPTCSNHHEGDAVYRCERCNHMYCQRCGHLPDGFFRSVLVGRRYCPHCGRIGDTLGRITA